MSKFIFLTSALLFFAGCTCTVDPALYSTPLPNGYRHNSNDGEYGVIKSPVGLIAQLAKQTNQTERWCNKFGSYRQWVVCEVDEYIEDGTKFSHKSYLFIDTSSGTVTEYSDLIRAKAVWRQLTSTRMPQLATDRWWRRI